MPPKRATSVVPEGTEEVPNVLRLLEQRRTEVLERRVREQLVELETELAGGARASNTALSGGEQDPPSRTVSESGSSKAQALPPPIYAAASFGELRKHIQGAVVYFDAIGEHDESRRIAVAASYCREKALSQWTRLNEKPRTWSHYKKVLGDMIQDPVNRMGSALLALKRLQQREHQSVRELLSYIEELEEDIPELSVEEQRAWALLNALHSGLRAAVLREERVIRTRDQVVSTAQRLQELGVVASESHPKRKRVDKEVHARGSREARSERTGKRACYACGKEGHLCERLSWSKRSCEDVRT
jgi:hypothetical protein